MPIDGLLYNNGIDSRSQTPCPQLESVSQTNSSQETVTTLVTRFVSSKLRNMTICTGAKVTDSHTKVSPTDTPQAPTCKTPEPIGKQSHEAIQRHQHPHPGREHPSFQQGNSSLSGC